MGTLPFWWQRLQPTMQKTQLNLHSHLRKVSSASWLAPPARSTRRAKSASRAETRKTCEGGAT